MKPLTNAPVQADALNPANAEKTSDVGRHFVPMNQVMQKFEVDPIPGYHLHWPVNNPARIARMLRAGYEFVKSDEAKLNGSPLGVDIDEGNMDLGTNVALPSGFITPQGQAEMHVLMKIPEELYQKSEDILSERNESIAAAIRGGHAGAGTPGDPRNRYVDPARTAIPDLFTPKRR